MPSPAPPIRPTALAVLALACLLGSAAGAAEAPKPANQGLIAIPTLIASVRRPNGVLGQFQVEAELDVPDAKLRTRASQSMPRLRDAYLRFVMIYAAATPKGSAPDPEQIGLQLQRATDRVLGRAGARVLLGSMVVD